MFMYGGGGGGGRQGIAGKGQESAMGKGCLLCMG